MNVIGLACDDRQCETPCNDDEVVIEFRYSFSVLRFEHFAIIYMANAVPKVLRQRQNSELLSKLMFGWKGSQGRISVKLGDDPETMKATLRSKL